MRKRISRKPPKEAFKLIDGPWKSHTIWLDSGGDGATGVFALGGTIGRYNHGKFQEMGRTQ